MHDAAQQGIEPAVEWRGSNHRCTVLASTFFGSAPSGGAIPRRLTPIRQAAPPIARMSRYRILKSVAHNWASSVLSLEYFDDDGYLVQYLVESARSHNCPVLRIDPLKDTIEPSDLRTRSISRLLSQASANFVRILESQGCSLDMVDGVELTIEYATLEKSPVVTELSAAYSFADPWKAPECVPHRSICTIRDDKGRLHSASPREWWRPGVA